MLVDVGGVSTCFSVGVVFDFSGDNDQCVLFVNAHCLSMLTVYQCLLFVNAVCQCLLCVNADCLSMFLHATQGWWGRGSGPRSVVERVGNDVGRGRGPIVEDRRGVGGRHCEKVRVFLVLLIMKDFCRFLTDFSQLYLLHWNSDIAKRNPAQVLPSLFARLGGKNSNEHSNDPSSNDQSNDEGKALSRRRNALEVMAALFVADNSHNHNNNNHNNHNSSNPFLRDSSVARLVVHHLVDRIEDAELSIRVRAASLFATLSPALVLPPLCQRMVSPR